MALASGEQHQGGVAYDADGRTIVAKGASTGLKGKGYQQLAMDGSVKTLTVPSGAKLAVIVASGDVRWRDDATGPTLTVGYPLKAGGELTYDAALADFKVIGAAGVLDIAYY